MTAQPEEPVDPGQRVAELVARLRALIDSAGSRAEAEAIRQRLEQIMHTYRVRSAALPAGPLEQAQELDSKYRARPHLEYLSSRLAAATARAERGESPRLLVSLPPRAGKSQMVQVWYVVWLLRRHPEWKIGLVSYDPGLATGWARQARRLIETNPELGIVLQPDGGAAGEWSTVQGGGVFATSVGGKATGYGFSVLLIDDPIKGAVEAHSMAYRNALWDWWLTVALLRLEPPGLVAITGCLTADARVLMGDGSERAIADVRPGDVVATYEGGALTTSVVRNWANVGPDHIYSVRMESGRVIRANDRHPFLVLTDGVESWRRADQLRPGDKILSVSGFHRGPASLAPWTGATFPSSPRGSAPSTPTGAAITSRRNAPGGSTNGSGGRALPAPLTTAPNPHAPRAYAHPTTTSRGGMPVTGAPPKRLSAEGISVTGTASTSRITNDSWPSRTGFALSASGLLLPRTPAETVSGALTTATTPERSAGCCATTAISSSGTAQPPNGSWPRPSTCAFEADTVASVLVTGYEDVFDIEVDRTHNFVANGLVTHNTRWHENDLAGRVLSPDHEGDPAEWEVINIPALAEPTPDRPDPLGREPGEPLLSPLYVETREQAIARWEKIREAVGSYVFGAMHQGRPTAPKGTIFKSHWWRYWTTNPLEVTDDVVLFDPWNPPVGVSFTDSWDLNFGDTESGSGSYVVGQRWAVWGTLLVLVWQWRGRWDFTETLDVMRRSVTEGPSPQLVTARLVEKKANGAAVIRTLRDKVGLIIPIIPRESKILRAVGVSSLVEAGDVLIPRPGDPGHEWVMRDFLPEMREFPNASDDQVDSLTQALARLRVAQPMPVGDPSRPDRVVPSAVDPRGSRRGRAVRGLPAGATMAPRLTPLERTVR